MRNHNPILEYVTFSDPADFKDWQKDNPKVVVFNTQFLFDSNNCLTICVVYTVQTEDPDQKPVDEEPVEKIQEATKPVDPNPKLN